MANRRIGILTGGGDVPGLNSVIKSVVYRSVELGNEVVGIRRGWEGLTHVNLKDPASKEIKFFPGREFFADLPNKGVERARLYLVGPRMYMIMQVGEKAATSADDFGHFAGSFKLLASK